MDKFFYEYIERKVRIEEVELTPKDMRILVQRVYDKILLIAEGVGYHTVKDSSIAKESMLGVFKELLTDITDEEAEKLADKLVKDLYL